MLRILWTTIYPKQLSYFTKNGLNFVEIIREGRRPTETDHLYYIGHLHTMKKLKASTMWSTYSFLNSPARVRWEATSLSEGNAFTIDKYAATFPNEVINANAWNVVICSVYSRTSNSGHLPIKVAAIRGSTIYIKDFLLNN